MKKRPCIATQKYYCTLNRRSTPRQCEMSLPGDPASLHKARRVSPSLADGRIAARAAASSFCIRVMRTVSLPADRQTDTKHAGIERVWGCDVLQMPGFIWQRLQEDESDFHLFEGILRDCFVLVLSIKCIEVYECVTWLNGTCSFLFRDKNSFTFQHLWFQNYFFIVK